ncbi:hypothetical protein PQX77_010696 [Marasmius sp. AFHP31]|nr:hypothetical protein PQX77_010696 [Marasmius sp. AFHP31]
MEAMKSMLSPLVSNTNALQDTLKLVVIGGTVETARRASVSAWNGFIDSFFLTAHFNQEDYPYDWLMHWLSKQPAWSRSREFEITTRSGGRHALSNFNAGDLEDEDDDGSLVHGRKKRRVQFLPSVDTTHTIYYRGHWLRITRTKRYPDFGGASIKVSVVARNNDILKRLVLDAKREYEKDAEHRVHIFMADTSYACWRWNGARQKRPMSSIVLQPGVKDMLLADCKDFLSSEDWYAERGIPFRRGYLLHGVPGSGKTSLIHSLAGELGLDIYVVSLSAKGMSDNTLTTLMGNVPSRCILLLEDLDAAFTRGISRDANSTGVPTKEESEKGKDKESDGSTLSLSGLLNSLDGVAAAEGRLLFATTNHIERLDPALSRPGRMDVWVNFGHATKWQAEGIFKCFFPFKPAKTPSPPTSIPTTPESTAPPTPTTEAAPSLPSTSQPEAPSSTHTTNTPGLRKPAPLLTEEELDVLAKEFASHIPENELSVAALQGYLLKNKTRPRECVNEVAEWVEKEREVRKEVERKRKEEKEAQEKEKKEQEQKDKEKKTEVKEETKEKDKDTKETKDKETKEQKPRPKSSKSKKAESASPALSEPSASSSSASTSSPVKTDTTESTSSSSSESENTSGADADEETETVTSEEEDDKAEKNGEKSNEKWVAVKAASTQTAASTEPTVTAEEGSQ